MPKDWSLLRVLLSRFRSTFHHWASDQETDEELDAHLTLLAERFVRQGMEPTEAFYAARRQFGGVTQMKEQLREKRSLLPLAVLAQNVRHAFRQLRNAKSFTLSAALTLALGIGATTAVFSVLDHAVLRPLPFAEPDRLMAFASIDRQGPPHPTSLSYPTFFDFRRQNRVFEHLVSYRDERFTLNDSLPAIQVVGEIVSWDLFPLLGVQPALGRGFRPEEEARGTHVAVLSHGLWQSRFGGDPGILGKRIRINGSPFTITGVAPAGFRFPLDVPDVELWTTLAADATVSEFTPLTEQRGAQVLDAIGRLKPGVSAEQARASMDQVAGALAREYPDDNKNIATTSVVPELQRLTGKSRQPLLILLGAVALLLLIACANVANLLLARSTERQREFTLRTAIGASRGALVGQVLVESLALGLVGCAGGVLWAWLMLKAILPLAGEDWPRVSHAGIDLRVLLFSALAAFLTSVLFGVAPAIQVVNDDVAGALRAGAQTIARGHDRIRNALIITQVALGLVLVVGAELLIGSFLHLVDRDPGFRADHLLTFQIGLPDAQYNMASQVVFSDRLLQSLRAIPGVESVATGMPVPLTGSQMSISFNIEERRTPPSERPSSQMAIVTPGYFATLRIPLVAGRDFSERDVANSPRVLIVNEAFAHKFFPGENVIGKRIEPGGTNGNEGTRMREIVGVVGNAKQIALNPAPDPMYYFPYKQLSWGVGTIVLRTSAPPLAIESAARQVLAGLDVQVPMFKVRTGTELASTAIARPRFQMVLMGTFAASALLLTVMGLYGVLAYAVARRRREIGVRIALGAKRGRVLTLVLKQAGVLIAGGLALGVIGSVATGRLLTSMVYGFEPGTLSIISGACGATIVTGLLAAYLPAAQAASVDPMQALRSE